MTIGIATDFSQGPLRLDSRATSLALQGDGFFIVEGAEGQRTYTRDGNFRLNADSELVTPEGQRVLGFQADATGRAGADATGRAGADATGRAGADADFEIDRTELGPVRIPQSMTIENAEGEATELTGFSVTEEGRVQGHFTDGRHRDLGQLRVARFPNPEGLEHQGGNQFSPGVNSGLPVETDPGELGAASVVSGAVELSNTDIGANLIDLHEASNLFQTSLAVLDTTDNLLDELTNLGRMFQ